MKLKKYEDNEHNDHMEAKRQFDIWYDEHNDHKEAKRQFEIREMEIVDIFREKKAGASQQDRRVKRELKTAEEALGKARGSRPSRRYWPAF